MLINVLGETHIREMNASKEWVLEFGLRLGTKAVLSLASLLDIHMVSSWIWKSRVLEVKARYLNLGTA